jgi:hypothetical protein
MNPRAATMDVATGVPAAGVRRLGRSVLAVFLGLASTAALSHLADEAMRRLGVFPPGGQAYFGVWPFVAAVTYRSLFAVLGFAIAARLAPRRPLLHVGIVGGIGAAGGALGVVAAATTNLGPLWYPVAVLAMTLPCAWLGGVVLGARHHER